MLNNNALIFFGGMYFILSGVHIFYRAFLIELMKTRKRTVRAICKCVEIKRIRLAPYKITSTPVWEYQYGGETLKWSPNYSTNFAVPHVGQCSIIHLSPEDARVLYIKSSTGTKIKLIIFSMFFVGAGIMMIRNVV